MLLGRAVGGNLAGFPGWHCPKNSSMGHCGDRYVRNNNDKRMFRKDILVRTGTGDSPRFVPARHGAENLLRKQIMILFILSLKLFLMVRSLHFPIFNQSE